MINNKPDHFELHPEELNDGAKLVIAELVRDNISSINVPRIFSSVEEALKSGKNVNIRSDDPREYNDLAGTLESAFGEITDDGFKINVIEDHSKFVDYKIKSSFDLAVMSQGILNQGFFPKYLKLINAEMSDFLKDFKFTIWENIKGINGTMWADPVVPNKFDFVNYFPTHLMYSRFNVSTDEIKSNGSLFDRKLEIDKKTLHKLIDAYEGIRALDKFNQGHCYEMEYQITESGDLYFLQWRRMRDFTPTNFKLDRPLEEGEIEGSFVIGKTDSEGEILQTRFAKSELVPFEIDEKAEAICCMTVPFFKTRYPNARALAYYHESFDYSLTRALTHSGREAISASNLVTQLPIEYEQMKEMVERPLRFVADGNKCYVKQM